MASDALLRRFWNAAAVSAGSPMPGSLTLSKKRSKLSEPTVTSSARGAGTRRCLSAGHARRVRRIEQERVVAEPVLEDPDDIREHGASSDVDRSAAEPVVDAEAFRVRVEARHRRRPCPGDGAKTSMPGSRKGRMNCGSTPKNTPLEVEVALGSLTLPSVGATTFSAAPRRASPRISSRPPTVRNSALVNVTGAGSATSGRQHEHRGAARQLGHRVAPGANVLLHRSPHLDEVTDGRAGRGRAFVNTNMPSDVAGLPSSPVGWLWTKKPFDLRPVTIPLTVTTWLTRGEVAPLPCTAEINVIATSSLVLVTETSAGLMPL